MIELACHDVARPSFTNAKAQAGVVLYRPSEQQGGNRQDEGTTQKHVGEAKEGIGKAVGNDKFVAEG